MEILKSPFVVLLEELLASVTTTVVAAKKEKPQAAKDDEHKQGISISLAVYIKNVARAERQLVDEDPKYGELPANTLHNLMTLITAELVGLRTIEIGNIFCEFVVSGSGKKQKTTLEMSRMATSSTATSPVELPYYGTVVEAAAATSLRKEFLMPLLPKIKDDCIEGPELYLDGHSWVNPKRSTFCPAFAVPPLPKQSVDDSFVCGDGPEAKKRKTLAGLKYTPEASVQVAWRELIVSVPTVMVCR